MRSLPSTVWTAIAQFIPALCLKDMISVNSFFFNLAMDYRYRQISFTYLNERMLWTLVRLRDPAVSYRVKTVYIYPDFLKRELYTTQAPQMALRRTSDILRYKLFLKSGKCCIPPTFLLEWMQDVLSSLPNVNEYHVTWTGLPLSYLWKNPTQLISCLFKSAPIHRLTITISLENISSLDTNAFCGLSCIEELQIRLHDDPSQPLSSFTSPALITLANSINKLRKTLKMLNIEARGQVPLSNLLPLIAHLPKLEKLLITFPVDVNRELGDPSNLSTFIDRHCRSLRMLALRAEQPVTAGGGKRPSFSEPVDEVEYGTALIAPDSDVEPDSDWWSLQKLSRTCLQSLELSTAQIPHDTCLACIDAFKLSLTSLSITGSIQSPSFIEQVLSTFHGARGGGLRELRISSVTMTPRLIDLLATKAPRLERLCLYVKDVVPCTPPVSPTRSSCTRSSSSSSRSSLECRERREERIEAFFTEMETRRYPSWKLRHVKLVLSMPDADYWQIHIEELLAECVPSIRTFG
ncbi:hypothetical protein APHAL10511_000609 [Amanita phalloides]|nr:hypothetical protein APHAL10511_000609 [Amanita phalloides]